MQTPFINYSPQDETLAKRIYVDLLEAGIQPWAAAYDRMPGDDLLSAQKRALQAADTVVVLLSNTSDETQTQLSDLAREAGKTIISVVTDRGVKSDDPDAIKMTRRYAAGVAALVEKLPAEHEPLDDVPALQRGNEAYFIGDYDGASEAYAEMDADTARELHSRAAGHNALRNAEEALQDLNRAIELEPDIAVIYRNRSLALVALERYEEAYTDDQKAIELEPDLPHNWSSSAMTLLKLDRIQDALQAIDKAIELAPQNPHYRYQRGFVHAQTEDYESALTAYDEALELAPDHNDAQVGRRMVLGRLGRFDEALAEIDKEIKRKPRQGGHYVTRSLINFYMERYEDAVEDATHALERGADHYLPGLYNRAIAHWKLGHVEEAQSDLQKAIELNPEIGTEQGIRENAESELTRDAGLAILESLEEA